MLDSGKSGDVYSLMLERDPEHERDLAHAARKDSEISTPEAPGGRESLQELIPEHVPLPNVPDINSCTAGSPIETEEHVQLSFPRINSVNDIQSVSEAAVEISPLLLPRSSSPASFNTESYSSPESPVQISVPALVRHRDSWRASDHDLFSEEPMMAFDQVDENGELKNKSSKTGDKADDEFKHIVDGTKFENSLVEDYDSAKMIVGVRSIISNRADSVEDMEIQISTPVTNPEADGDTPRMNKSVSQTRRVPENAVFRQQNSEVMSAPHAPRNDRPRPEIDETSRGIVQRFTSSRRSWRTPVVSRGGRPVGPAIVGRSLSSSEARFEDWPEYTPSTQDEATRMGRRHASDMSFGVKDRKRDMLPSDMLNGERQRDEEYLQHDDAIPERFGGRGWKRRFGRGTRDANDVKGVMMNLLRRKRKGSNLGMGAGGPALHRTNSIGTVAARRFGNSEPEVAFESELTQDMVFSLLTRICPECGYELIVRKPNYKLKAEVMVDGSEVPLLISIILTKLSHGRNTMVSIARSRDDVSRAPGGEIEGAASALQRQLQGHVQYMDDSFASLYFNNSTIDLNTGGNGSGQE